MKKLTISCKGVADISSMSGDLSIELESVSMDFIEDISIYNILMYCNNTKLLENMEYEVIADFLEKHYGVEIKEKK